MIHASLHCQLQPVRPSAHPATLDRIHLPILKLFDDPAYSFSFSTASAQEPYGARPSSNHDSQRRWARQCSLQTNANRPSGTTQTPSPATSSPHPLARLRSSEPSASPSRPRPQNGAEKSTNGYELRRWQKTRIEGSGKSKSSS